MTIKKRIKNATPPMNVRVSKRRPKAAPLKTEPAPAAARPKKPSTAAGSGSKTDKILDLLKQPGGVTLNELAKATGWKPNSVRGFLSGAIGKKMGTPVESFKSTEGDRSYRLSAK